MTDRDVIWVNPRAPHSPYCQFCFPDKGKERAYIPLSRATQLQQALTVIAEGLENYQRAVIAGLAPDPNEMIRDMKVLARKALTEFEEKEE